MNISDDTQLEFPMIITDENISVLTHEERMFSIRNSYFFNPDETQIVDDLNCLISQLIGPVVIEMEFGIISFCNLEDLSLFVLKSSIGGFLQDYQRNSGMSALGQQYIDTFCPEILRNLETNYIHMTSDVCKEWFLLNNDDTEYYTKYVMGLQEADLTEEEYLECDRVVCQETVDAIYLELQDCDLLFRFKGLWTIIDERDLMFELEEDYDTFISYLSEYSGLQLG